MGEVCRFLYVTDLHGDRRAYARLPELCKQQGVSILVNGGDLLPKHGDMRQAQGEFLRHDMPALLDACASAGIRYYALFGNDDLRAWHDEWLALVDSCAHAFDLERRWLELDGGYFIRGNSWVPDYPFGLKDWCLRDRPDATPVPTRRSITTSPAGIDVIADPVAFFAARPTMQEHLETLVDPALPMDRCVLVTHAPPHGLGLGLLHDHTDVGSRGVRAFIERHQPLLTLSGHIHESPEVSRSWGGNAHHTARSGRTTCHQPGQELPYRLSVSVIEIDDCDGTPDVRITWNQLRLNA